MGMGHWVISRGLRSYAGLFNFNLLTIEFKEFLKMSDKFNMKFFKFISLLLLVNLLAACEFTNLLVNIKESKASQKIDQVRVIENQLIVTGINLESTTAAEVRGLSQHEFEIESKSSTKLILNPKNVITFIVGETFNLIISSAHGSSSFPISFQVQDGQITAAKIHSMGANAGDVLTYNGSTWGPAAPASGTSQWTSGGTGIEYANNVGIGMTPAADKLMVNGSGTFYGKFFADYSGTNDALHVHQLGTGNIAAFSNGVGFVEKIVIDSTGRLGVNNPLPQALFHITEPDDSWSSSFRMDRSWDSTTDYFQMMYDYEGLKIRTMDDDGEPAHIIFKPRNTEALRITDTGNVGIGDTNPSAKLGVVGNVDIAGDLIVSGTFTNPSDRRLKVNIEPLTRSLSKISAIKGVSYYWKDPQKYAEGRQLGVIAQEVEKVFPEAVVTNKQGMKSVSYISLLSPMIEAIKEVFASNQEQNQKILALEEENTKLKAYLCQKDPAAPFCHLP